MASSGEEYLIAREKQIARKKRILTIVSMISFFGSMAFAGISTVQRAIQNPQPVTQTVSAEFSLQEQAKGYELVLQREPNNQTALEKLSLVRVQLKDFKGAREPLEKLMKLHPDRKDYQVILEDMKKREKLTEKKSDP
ncbi:tetratricopeptide repeat protein [Anabaena subtropica]|uniref:Tetratricopeptide repeat protein n=1 Tax=Anabaena subtropica FACHB-260 TaxID=2692884 RepID=A0ABR8CNR7_9NOST|nr:tetratricopeptide repeat protein [Anabaena subtropica]MBD2344441.1 tetratricopeptide repeat protein [Anabaena subtropica FACHB-260]